MTEQLECEVCVVGAGYAGLTAAHRLARRGIAVVVLEARGRIGGRIWTEHLEDGSVIDRGGAWLAPNHTAIAGLAAEVGVTTFKTHVAGAHLLVDGDRTRRYTGLIPKISPLAIVTLAVAQARLNRMARHVSVESPWTANRAPEWDAATIASWLARSGVRSGIARDLFEMALRGLFPGDLDDVSLLDLLFLIRAHGSIETLFSIEGGAQENLIDGGAGAIAERMAAGLGDAVHLDAPVRSIRQRDDRVVVVGADLVVTCERAIVTTPPALVLDIEFEPELTEDRRALYRAAVAGPETKTLVVYDEPFWRADGFSGQTAHPGSAAEVTIDASPRAGAPGVLASFTFGPVAERMDRMDPAERRDAVVGALTRRLGPRAATPLHFVETAWWNEEWTRGCSMAHFPPGVLSAHGRLLREPFGRVHWAGTETATISHGAIDGAVRSGERAAAEVRTAR